MGKLLCHASALAATELWVDLLVARDKSDPEYLVGLVAGRYGRQMRKQLTAQKLSPSWVVTARIHVDFSVSKSDLKQHEIYGCGQAYCCTVEIVDDRGRLYVAKAYGRANKHDPGKECCSVRRDEL
jgi:hypothetical protein